MRDPVLMRSDVDIIIRTIEISAHIPYVDIIGEDYELIFSRFIADKMK